MNGRFSEGSEQVKGLSFSAVDKQPIGVFTAETDLLTDRDLLI
jgi:hypothetical protein